MLLISGLSGIGNVGADLTGLRYFRRSGISLMVGWKGRPAADPRLPITTSRAVLDE
jgi:hypothetical protein